MEEVLVVDQDGALYWKTSYAFLKVMAMELNEALKASGIEDVALREQICSRFGFGLGNFLDQGYLEVEGRRSYPLLCFSEQFLNSDSLLEEIAPLQLPDKEFEFHGAADDAAKEFFRGHGEQLGSEELRVGSVGGE